MLPEGLNEQGIRELSEIGKLAPDIRVQFSKEEQDKAKAEIEAILPPESGYVTIPYVRQVLIGLEYAKTHFRCSMLEDIIAGKEINESDYKKCEEGKVLS